MSDFFAHPSSLERGLNEYTNKLIYRDVFLTTYNNLTKTEVILEDSKTGVTHNFLTNQVYHFNGEKTDIAECF